MTGVQTCALPIYSLLAKNNDLISKTENLIIDLRNNGGGSDASYNKIIPYLYTNPIRGLGVQYLSTKLNNKRMNDFINSPDWSEEDKKWAKEGLEKLNKHIGEFVNLEDDIVSIDTLDTVLPYPKNVGILINGNCGSTTEQFCYYSAALLNHNNLIIKLFCHNFWLRFQKFCQNSLLFCNSRPALKDGAIDFQKIKSAE